MILIFKYAKSVTKRLIDHHRDLVKEVFDIFPLLLPAPGDMLHAMMTYIFIAIERCMSRIINDDTGLDA